MGCSQNLKCGHRPHYLTIYLLVLVISSSSQLRFHAEGRKSIKTVDSSQRISEEKKVILRARIGSRPPRCERRCSTCGHCEAIQVPTNPPVRSGNKNSTTDSFIAYARGDDNSNYKPMSWKCKCGDLIFNP